MNLPKSKKYSGKMNFDAAKWRKNLIDDRFHILQTTE